MVRLMKFYWPWSFLREIDGKENIVQKFSYYRKCFLFFIISVVTDISGSDDF